MLRRRKIKRIGSILRLAGPLLRVGNSRAMGPGGA
jgi:hypothetical protein